MKIDKKADRKVDVKVGVEEKIIFANCLIKKITVAIDHVNQGGESTRSTEFTAKQLANEFKQFAKRCNVKMLDLTVPVKFIPPDISIYCVLFKPTFENVQHFMKFILNRKHRSIYIRTMYCKPKKKKKLNRGQHDNKKEK